jgi:UDP-N-acetylmuramyl pentapeptide phosphotransferase/UDP-N-acetylglucosamine-1-phosphate transferase
MFDPITDRSSHRLNATRSGGLAMFFAFCICYGVGKATGLIEINLYALLCFCLIALIGVGDDLFKLKYREKFFLQLFAGIVLLQSGMYIDSFHGIFGIEELPYAASVAVSLFVFIVVVNSLNLIDGIDGLASLLSLKYFLVTGAILSVSSKEMELVVPVIVGSTVGFLSYNFNPNKKVFLGDTGSLLLGSVMSFFIFYTLNTSSFIVTDGYISRPLFVVLLLIYPLADTLRAFVIRVYKKQSPFVADRIHLHHRLLNKGISHWRASVTILISSISVLLAGLLLSQVFPLGITVMILFVYLSILYYTVFK